MRLVASVRRLGFGIGLLAITSGVGWSQTSACDLVAPFGTVDAADVQAIINMTLGILPCTANIGGPGVCNAAVVQRVVNAALGGTCVTGSGTVSHYIILSWTASASQNVIGYNVYGSTTPGGPYTTKLNPSLVVGTNYTDSAVSAGLTYYYVIRAVDNTGTESANSSQTPASLIPTP